MSSVTAWKHPSSASSVTRTGGAVSWSVPLRAISSNDSYTTAALSLNATHWLWLTGFGFTTSDIPAGSTIVGIEVSVELKQTAGTASDGVPVRKFLKMIIGGAEAGTQKTADGHLPTSDTVQTSGGSSDVWGTSITAAQAIASDTGVAFAFQDADYLSTTVSVDDVQIRFHYNPPATGKASPSSGVCG